MRDLGLFGLEKKRTGKGLINAGWDQGVVSGVQQEHKGEWAQTGAQKVPNEVEQKNIHFQDD